jgi:acetyl-CoA C-acetyltransferase
LRKVCVIGVGQTRFGRLPYTTRDLALMAAREAVEDAGIDVREIQGCFVSNAFSWTERQGHLGPLIMSGLGIATAPATVVESACASGSSAIREAYVNIMAGMYDVMLVVGVERVQHLDTIRATTYFTYGGDYLFEGGVGASFPGLYAAIARAHMAKYGTTEEQMALVAVKNHDNGLLNPKAHIHKKITVEDVLKSPVVAHPLKLYDCCPFSDGAAAAVLCSEDYARRMGAERRIYIRGSGRAGGPLALHDREDLTSLIGTRLAAEEAFRRAGLDRKSIDFAEVHDAFTIAEIVALEDLGFYEKGEAARAVENGETRLGGRFPVNPSGGLKSKGHPVGATGVGQLVEIFDQLTERAGPRQVHGARVALAHNVGATGGSVVVTIYSRDPPA